MEVNGHEHKVSTTFCVLRINGICQKVAHNYPSFVVGDGGHPKITYVWFPLLMATSELR